MFLIVYRPRGTTGSNYDLSKSRDAMKHIENLNAQTVWVYDKNGYWVSFADRDQSGKPYRPKMYSDGEPKAFYSDMFQRLSDMAKYLDGNAPLL
jgi:hypothetical protein